MINIYQKEVSQATKILSKQKVDIVKSYPQNLWISLCVRCGL